MSVINATDTRVPGSDNVTANRQSFRQPGRWVVKIGSALLTNNGLGLDETAIEGWVGQIAELIGLGYDIILVSSGSVAAGLARLGFQDRPQHLFELQAVASVGQMGLINAYEQAFKRHSLTTAQILLTHEDLSDRERYLNARSTLEKLLDYGVIPIINENDTVVTEGIRFGDNDTLAGLVSNLMQADVMVILTDQKGLYDSDPRSRDDAKLISKARASDPELLVMASGPAGKLGMGGMLTKIKAARLAQRSGTQTLICSGRVSNSLLLAARGDVVGTHLIPDEAPVNARKRWLAGQLKVKGMLYLDAGAARVLRHDGTSLLPVGVTRVTGSFRRGDLVSICDEQGNELARGLVNYPREDAQKILRQPSSNISAILGYCDDDELVHRDNLALIASSGAQK